MAATTTTMSDDDRRSIIGQQKTDIPKCVQQHEEVLGKREREGKGREDRVFCTLWSVACVIVWTGKGLYWREWRELVARWAFWGDNRYNFRIIGFAFGISFDFLILSFKNPTYKYLERKKYLSKPTVHLIDIRQLAVIPRLSGKNGGKANFSAPNDGDVRTPRCSFVFDERVEQSGALEAFGNFNWTALSGRLV